jgi:outer membrane translocation and assembly module TamA
MRDPRTFQAALRYWTDEKLDGGVRWEHRNLFKRGRGGFVIASASAIRQRLEFTGWWPNILWVGSRASFIIGARRENEEAYEEIDTGFEVAMRHLYSLQTTFRLGLGFSNVDVTRKIADAEVPNEAGVLTTMTFSIEDRRTDEFINPHSGTYLLFATDWSPQWAWSDNTYVKGDVTASTYFQVTKGSVFAMRLTPGLAEPIGDSESILISRRFFSGGANSMRGFRRRRLGPKDVAGSPVGGEVRIEASMEYRFRIAWRFWGTVFIDAGQVWSKRREAQLDEIEVAVGPGLWLNTPVGPLRLDYGYRLTDFDPDPRYAIHFSIGPAF